MKTYIDPSSIFKSSLERDDYMKRVLLNGLDSLSSANYLYQTTTGTSTTSTTPHPDISSQDTIAKFPINKPPAGYEESPYADSPAPSLPTGRDYTSRDYNHITEKDNIELLEFMGSIEDMKREDGSGRFGRRSPGRRSSRRNEFTVDEYRPNGILHDGVEESLLDEIVSEEEEEYEGDDDN